MAQVLACLSSILMMLTAATALPCNGVCPNVNKGPSFRVPHPSEPAGKGPGRQLLQNVGPYTGTKANYSSVLGLSWYFYEAQRSGRLPATNRVPWRGNSHLNDKVVGGWYDAGDSLKLNYPMAMSVSYLAWSVLQFPTAYNNAEAMRSAADNLKWGCDYLAACHISDYQYVGQTGSVDCDHSYQGRIEDDPCARPVYIWNANSPASDLLGVVSAALTSCSLVFQSGNTPAAYRNTTYAAALLAKAQKLYTWARSVKGSGKFNTAFPEGQVIYESYTGWRDKLMYAAAWLFRATGNTAYLNQAQTYWDAESTPSNTPSIYVGYDTAFAPAVNLLLSFAAAGTAVPGVSKYRDWMNNEFLPNWFKADGSWDIYRTPKGLVIVVWDNQDPWASLRTSLNVAFQMVLHAQLSTTSATNKAKCLGWAKSQADYALGSAGRSFVVGWGTNPPTHAHHRAASCPLRAGSCSDKDFQSPNPNPHVIYGALVGGPGRNDVYADVRADYYKNEVSVDANAGFTATLAGLLELL